VAIASPDLKTQPQAGELWLSRPPFLFVALVVGRNDNVEPPLVSYVLYDEDGCSIEQISHVSLDRSWWHSFQPMERRYG
jgi:hypothetical protein